MYTFIVTLRKYKASIVVQNVQSIKHNKLLWSFFAFYLLYLPLLHCSICVPLVEYNCQNFISWGARGNRLPQGFRVGGWSVDPTQKCFGHYLLCWWQTLDNIQQHCITIHYFNIWLENCEVVKKLSICEFKSYDPGHSCHNNNVQIIVLSPVILVIRTINGKI